MLLTLASCCGPEPLSQPGDVLTWAIIGLGCAVLLLGLALCVFIARRKHGSHPWLHAGVLAPAALALLALVLAQEAWSAYQAWQVTDPAVYTNSDWYAHLAAEAQIYGSLGVLLAAGTLLTLGIGGAYLLMHWD